MKGTGLPSGASGAGGSEGSEDLVDAANRRPAGMCLGPGHLVVYGNPAFLKAFGREAVGLPAREVMLGLPREGFALMDAVLQAGRPLARWIEMAGEEWRLTVRPRTEPDADRPYGVSFHLRARADQPIIADDPGSI